MSNAATVQAIYEAFGAGDVPTILGHVSDDVQWESWADNSAANAGLVWMRGRQGKDGVLEFLGSVADWKFEQFDVVDLLESPTKVAAEMEITYVLPDGTRVQDQEVHLWSFDEAGRVTRFRHYLDTAKHTKAHLGAKV